MDYEKRLVATLIYINERIEYLDIHLETTPEHRELLGLRAQLVGIKRVLQGGEVTRPEAAAGTEILRR